MKSYQYSIVPPLLNTKEGYYEDKIEKLIKEIEIFLTKNNNMILGIYDLIDEPNRITNEIILQKKRLNPLTYLIKIKKYIEKNNLSSNLTVKFRIFRAIKENETIYEFIDWVKNKANLYCDDFVIIGNYKNKSLRTDDVLNKLHEIECVNYGCFIDPYRPNELERCKKRIKNGCSFFINQIIVDSEFPTDISNFYSNIEKPIYFSITFVTSQSIWNICKSLGVVSNFNFGEKINYDDNICDINMTNVIMLVKKHNQFINLDIMSYNTENRLKLIKRFNGLI